MLQFTVVFSFQELQTSCSKVSYLCNAWSESLFFTSVSCMFLKLYAELGPTNTRSNHVPIANATKKSSDVLINTGVASTKKPKSLSPLVGRGNRRIEVQRPLPEGI